MKNTGLKENPAPIRRRLIDGAAYNLGATTGTYRAESDSFALGNCHVGRHETIYADNADPLFMRDVREAEITRNLAYAQNPNLPKAGDRIWNTGHEFIVTDPQALPVTDAKPGGFTHQFNYKGIATDHEANASIRGTSYDGGHYGWGIVVKEGGAL